MPKVDGKGSRDWEVGLHMQWVSELTCVVGLSLENLQPQEYIRVALVALCYFISRDRSHLTDTHIIIIIIIIIIILFGSCLIV